MPALEPVRDVFRTLLNMYVKTFANIVSNVNLKILTNSAEVSILNACLGPECVSGGGYNTVPRITANKDGIISIKSLYLKFRQVKCLNIRWPLKELSKVYARWCSQEYLFGKVTANYYQNICGQVYC